MIDSKGSAPLHHILLRDLSKRYAYIGWFLLGILPTFGIVMSSISSRLHYAILGVPEENSGVFESNILTLAILCSCLGLITAYICCPVNLVMLQSSIIISVVMSLFSFVALIIPNLLGKVLYFLAVCTLCYFLGIIEMISLASVNNKFIHGTTNMKLFFFILGHPIGYMLVILISTILEVTSIGSGEEHDFLHEAIVFDMYQIMVMMLMVIPITVVIYDYLHQMTNEEYKWEKSNIINRKPAFVQSLKLLLSKFNYVVLLILLEASEAFFNSVIVLFLIDPFPHFHALFKSLIIFIFHELFDLFGRFMPTAIVWIISKTKLVRTYSSNTLNDEDVENGKPEEKVVVHLATNSIIKIPNVTYSKVSAMSLVAVLSVWLVVVIRIGICLCLFFQRHFKNVPFLKFMVRFPMAMLLTIFNSSVRGLTVSFVYSRIAENNQNKKNQEDFDHPNELHGFTAVKLSATSEPEECLDITADRDIVICFLIALVKVIELVPALFWYYIGYKYNRILFECELIMEQTGSWPTDYLESNYEKSRWWLKMILKAIWRDIKNPFDIINTD